METNKWTPEKARLEIMKSGMALGAWTDQELIAFAKKCRTNRMRRERDQAMRDCGLVKVKGALGGTYWE